MAARALPLPIPGDEVDWVRQHLGDLADGPVQASDAIRGGQAAADRALATFDVTGYAERRNTVLPIAARGASGLSPYVRHGLISLPRLWRAVSPGPSRDVSKFRDELLWQEYARHLYARTDGMAENLRFSTVERGAPPAADWVDGMACLEFVTRGLEADGWLVNQTRMWFASHWTVRHGRGWRDGEDHFFRHLLDGSRAANRLGWQWTVGSGNGKAYGFARTQVERRAPGLCAGCALRAACPIERYPDEVSLPAIEPASGVRSDPDPDATAGPAAVETSGSVDRVWITAESLGDEDPALQAHPEAPAVFVFDEPLLARLRLSGKRLVFLAECLADLGERRSLEILRGEPAGALAGGGIATTFAPVPGWRRRAMAIHPAEVHPWRWLVRPHGGPAGSFTAWSKRARPGR